MAPVMSRQLFIWTLPTLFLLSFLWYKRKKSAAQSDPGGTEKNTQSGFVAVTNDKAFEEVEVATEVQSDLLAEINTKVVLEVDNIVENISDNGVEKWTVKEVYSTSLESESVETSEVIPLVGNAVEARRTLGEILNDSKSVVDILDESDSVLYISDESNSTVNISDETTSLIDEDVDQVPSQLNPEAKDFIAQNPEHVVDTPISDIEPVSTAESCSIADIPALESEAVVVEEPLNKTWAEECEGIESEEKAEEVEMARELSTDVPLAEEGCAARKANVETASLERDLATLELDGTKVTAVNKVLAGKESGGAERDSANHSPAEVMLGSPSMSNCSDAHSEGSSDSGKGCSDVATPPSRTPASGSSVSGDPPTSSVYEFVLPQLLVGRLIGRHGVFVHQIKTNTNANILIKRHPDTAKLKICAVEGSAMDIENALEMIREKFPLKRYPHVTLDQVSFLAPSAACPLLPESFQLQLIEGVNNDVILSSLVSPAHFFLQQPTHPTYPALNRLNICMNYCYNEPTAPVLPTPVEDYVICVAPTMGGWYRAQVVASDPASDTSDVKFIDYGGYQTIANSMLRQIRSDFIHLPFQASECYLANVKPKGGAWPAEALAFVEQMTHGQVIQAQIYGYAEDGIPVVYLYSYQSSQVLVVNRELVSQGFAEWDEPTEVVESEAPVVAAET